MLISVNGNITRAEEARISVLDHGFLYGDSVFEVIRTHGRRPFRLIEHLDRMSRSAAGIRMQLPTRESLVDELYRTAVQVEGDELYLRVIVTRGVGWMPLPELTDHGTPGVVVMAANLPPIPPRMLQEGCALALVDTRRNSPEALNPAFKTGNYLNNLLAMLEARDDAADEAILLNARGEVAEGTRSNLFLVRGGTVLTPPLETGILAGVTRLEVIDVCRTDGIEIQEATLTPEDLTTVEEAFITSTTKGILPASRLGVWKGAAPGPVTRRLLLAWEVRIQDFLRGAPGRYDGAIPSPISRVPVERV